MPFHRSPIELTALKDLVGASQRGFCALNLSGQGTAVGFNPLLWPCGLHGVYNLKLATASSDGSTCSHDLGTSA
jgi:hypothetical protein